MPEMMFHVKQQPAVDAGEAPFFDSHKDTKMARRLQANGAIFVSLCEIFKGAARRMDLLRAFG
jgi:hypothetical protein